MSCVSPCLDATATALAGLLATHLGWYHPALSGPADATGNTYWRAERCIGPLLLAVAAGEFVLMR